MLHSRLTTTIARQAKGCQYSYPAAATRKVLSRTISSALFFNRMRNAAACDAKSDGSSEDAVTDAELVNE